MTRPVVAVDPGGRTTGIVVRDGAALVAAELVHRHGPAPFPDARYLLEVVDTIGDYLDDHQGAVVAVEGVVHPNGHVRLINACGLLGTATVLGAVLGRFPTAVVVPPAKHGAGPRNAYPPALWGDDEPRGAGRRRHVRSAWDIAAAGTFLAQLETTWT